VTATPEELNKWLGSEAVSEPVQVATPFVKLQRVILNWFVFSHRHYPFRWPEVK